MKSHSVTKEAINTTCRLGGDIKITPLGSEENPDLYDVYANNASLGTIHLDEVYELVNTIKHESAGTIYLPIYVWLDAYHTVSCACPICNTVRRAFNLYRLAHFRKFSWDDGKREFYSVVLSPNAVGHGRVTLVREKSGS